MTNFLLSCKTNDISGIEKLFSNQIRLNDDAYNAASLYGQLDVMKWLYAKKAYIKTIQPLRNACSSDHIDLVMWLHENFPELFTQENILNALEHCRSMKTFKFLDEMMETREKYDHVYVRCCILNYEDIFDYLESIDNFHIDMRISKIYTEGFRKACQNGSISIAKKIYAKYDLDRENEIEHSFRWSIMCGKLNITEWLFKLYPDINLDKHYLPIFKMILRNNHIISVQWLLEHGYIPSKELKEYMNIHFNSHVYYKRIKELLN